MDAVKMLGEIILETSRKTADKDSIAEYAKLLYDQALLIEGRSIEDPVAYANNVAELLAQ